MSATTVPEMTSDPLMLDQKLVWDAYAKDISHRLSDFMRDGSLVDTTLVAGGEKIRVHRMVLCATSSFLKVNIIKIQNILFY
jgi:hypothetical protein